MFLLYPGCDCTLSVTFSRADSSVPPPVIAAVDISIPRDVRVGLNSSERESGAKACRLGRTTEMVCPRSRVKKRSSARSGHVR